MFITIRSEESELEKKTNRIDKKKTPKTQCETEKKTRTYKQRVVTI